MVCPYNHDYDIYYHKKYLCYIKNKVILITKIELENIFKLVNDTFGDNFVNSLRIN